MDTAVALGANVVSNSYGGSESGATNSAYNHPGRLRRRYDRAQSSERRRREAVWRKSPPFGGAAGHKRRTILCSMMGETRTAANGRRYAMG